MTTISFICVLYNHDVHIVQRMIDSVDNAMLYCEYFKYDFIIVDNSDTKGNYKDLTSLSNIVNIHSDINSGYCLGNNIGIKHSSSEFIIIINPDIIIMSSLCIDWLVGSAKLNNSISGRLIGTNEWYTYSSSFPTDSKYEPSELPFFSNEPTLNKDGNWKPFRYIDGSLMCFSKSLFDDVGGFDSSIFPGYFGENAFCFVAFLKGYSISESHIKEQCSHEPYNRTPQDQIQIYNWSKLGRQLFYEKYALPNWDKFIEYVNK